MDFNNVLEQAARHVDDAEEEGYADGKRSGKRSAVLDGYKLGCVHPEAFIDTVLSHDHFALLCSALSGDVALEEVGAYSALAEIILILESTRYHEENLKENRRERGNRSAALVAESSRQFPINNLDARQRDVPVGADLQRLRARSKAMLAAACLSLPEIASGGARARDNSHLDVSALADSSNGVHGPATDGGAGFAEARLEADRPLQAVSRPRPAGIAGVDLMF